MLLNCSTRIARMIVPNCRQLLKNGQAKNCRMQSTQIDATEQKIQINNQTINYLKVGNGDQVLFCFPGALGTVWSDFKPQIQNLDRDKFTIIAWDPPGYGYSRPPDKKFSINFYKDDADMAHKFLQEIGVKRFSLLGWSDGGISGIILAASYPQSVENLVIWGSNSYINDWDIKAYNSIKDLNNWSPRMKEPLIKLYTDKGLQDLWNGWCETLEKIYANGGNICKEYLEKVQCPTFIIHGDKDPMVAPEHPSYLNTHIKNSKLFRFPDGKHNIHLKYAQEFNKLVTGFISKL